MQEKYFDRLPILEKSLHIQIYMQGNHVLLIRKTGYVGHTAKQEVVILRAFAPCGMHPN